MITAVIMAGGEGSRLRPLTCDLPKPMARLCGRPTIEYILDLLVRHGVTNATVTLGYLSHVITDYFSDGHRGDIQLEYALEDRPLGTAGSVKNACPSPEDHLLIISGDALCDFDLSAAIRRHRESGADATLVVKAVEDPREYGLVCSDGNGAITGFVEKPSYYQAVSELANTGIYILSPAAVELIPKGKKFDFAKDLFPLMMARGMSLMSVEDEGYWCDIGDLGSYHSCQRDILEGRVRCALPGRKDRNGNVYGGLRPRGRYTVIPPVYIGEGVHIGDNAVIEAGSVIDDRCRIGQSVRVSGSVLLEGCSVGYGASLTGAVVCAGGVIGERAMLFEGSTLGFGARVGAGAQLAPGVKIWPGRDIASYAQVSGTIKQTISTRGWFDDDGIGDGGCARLSPEVCARIGGAVGAASLGPVGLAGSDDPAAQLYKTALAAGIQGAGQKVLDFGEGTRALYNFAMHLTGAALGIYITGGKNICVQITGQAGLPVSRSVERTLEAILSRGESNLAERGKLGVRADISGMWALYCSHLAKQAPQGLEGVGCILKCSNPALERQAREVLSGLGCNLLTGFTLWIDTAGDRVTLFESSRVVVHHHRLLAILCADEFEQGNDVALPYDAPRAIDTLAQRYGRRVLRYYSCPVDDSDQEARDLAAIQFWSRDALMMVVRLLDIYRRKGMRLDAMMEGIPGLFVTERTAQIQGNPGKVISKLSSGTLTGGEGAVIKRGDSTVFVRSSKNGGALRIFAEAPSSEAASELCADILRKLGAPGST